MIATRTWNGDLRGKRKGKAEDDAEIFLLRQLVRSVLEWAKKEMFAEGDE